MNQSINPSVFPMGTEMPEQHRKHFTGADCVNVAKEMGVIYGTGVYEKGEIRNTPVMEEAYEMGRRV